MFINTLSYYTISYLDATYQKRFNQVVVPPALLQKNAPVKGREQNLMFSQRNNPYCELHKISDAKIGIFIYICKYLRKNRILYTYQHKKTNN